MPNEIHVVSFRCSNCGAALKVPADVSTLACGYCGSEQIVERSGGIVTLRPVIAALQRVQAGTDKTAAELALARLDREASLLAFERERILQGIAASAAAESSAERQKGRSRIGIILSLGLVAGFVLGGSTGHLALLLGVCVSAASGIAGWFGLSYYGNARATDSRGRKAMLDASADFATRRSHIEAEILKNRSVVRA
jgi:DNA-directed RNA polymerase subunit RPC12/RpoP